MNKKQILFQVTVIAALGNWGTRRNSSRSGIIISRPKPVLTLTHLITTCREVERVNISKTSRPPRKKNKKARPSHPAKNVEQLSPVSSAIFGSGRSKALDLSVNNSSRKRKRTDKHDPAKIRRIFTLFYDEPEE